MPYVNPDLFWHLSAGRRIAETGSVPRADWLSFTFSGASWVDFEWLTQLLWHGAFSAAGWWGLWALKAALFSIAGALLWKALGLYKLPLEAKAGWLLAWALALMPANDLRPENASLAGFGLLWWWVERERLEAARKPHPREIALFAAGFMLWANLHAGFAYGLLLLALAALAAEPERRPRLAAVLAAGFCGTLLNPWGLRLYPILVEHARAIGDLARVIKEWQPPTMKDPWLWPFWALFLGTFSIILERQTKGELPKLHALAICVFGLSAGRHVRTIPYFAAAAVPVAAAAFSSMNWKARRAAGWAGLAALFVYAGLRVVPEVGAKPFRPTHVPQGVADFLEAEEAVLGGKKMAHPMEWGGYLGYRFGTRFPIFADGRYLFHGIVRDSLEATAEPELYRKFVDELGADVVLLKRSRDVVYTEAPTKEGRKLVLFRPSWLFFVPRPDWALVYYDEQGMVFIRRTKAPKDWLASHEYTLYRPGDAEAAKWMIKDGNAKAETLVLEKLRFEAARGR
ncbi:MAG: hypothetical protein HY925_15730 [Elusimicrobia bacterium]|nr:hypothetical protein [Elusimicrobiota bacterium]